MKTSEYRMFLIIMMIMMLLPNAWAQQSVGQLPTPTPTPIRQELTPEQFVDELAKARNANNYQRIRQLVAENPGTAGIVYLALFESGKGDGKDAQFHRKLASSIENFPIVRSLAQAGKLHLQVNELLQQGRYVEGLPLAERELAIWEKALRTDHPQVASSLNNLALLYWNIGAYAKAEPLFQRALAIWEKVLGPDHPDTATSLNNIALLYYNMGTYAKAEPLLQRALKIFEKTFGPKHPKVATSLNNLAGVYQNMGAYVKAELLYQRALAIREKAMGPEHPDTAQSLNNLAELYKNMGAYAIAEPLYQRALAIWEKTLGLEHQNVAYSLNNLADLYQNMGAYAKAEPLDQRALAIREKALGPDHPDTAQSLNNLASLYVEMGAYAKAEPLYQRALVIHEKVMGPDHSNTAISLNNLSLLYKKMGAYTKAEPLYRRVLAICEKAVGPDHPNTAISLANLAELYRTMGAYAKAEPFYQRAVSIREKTLGTYHPDTAASLNNLAVLYLNMGTYAKAEPLLQRTLAIWEKTLGLKHPYVADCLNNLAGLYHNMGAYAKAEPFYQRALAIREKALGTEHPSVAVNLNNLAILYAALDNPDRAHPLFLQVQQIHSQLIEQVMGFTSEAQKLDFLTTVRWELCGFLSLASQRLSQNPSVLKDGLDIWLQRKGVVLEAQKRFQDALFYSDDPEAVKTVQALAQVRAQLTHLTFADPGKASPKEYKQRLADLKAQKDTLEATMSRLSQTFVVTRKVAKADTQQVAAALPAHTALLEFARTPMLNFKATGPEEKWQPAHYLAFILFAGNGDDVRLVDLGDAATIDQAVAAFKQTVTNLRADRTGAQSIAAAQHVYQLVFAPLRKELGEVNDLFISPDGNLNLIPFEVLVDPDGHFLIESYSFNYLGAGRDLLAFGAFKEQGNPPLLMGDPDFDLEPTPGPNTPLRPPQGGNEPTPNPSQEGKGRSGDMRGFNFRRLPGTCAEVEAIQTLLKPTPGPSQEGNRVVFLYTDKAAREAELLNHPAPRILHLATHGFFLEDQDLSAFASPTRSGDALAFSAARARPKIVEETPQPLKNFVQFENPLVRSGIALAGANKATGVEGETEGMITAEKILGLKLRGTELVVLSACETGLGQVQSGEGVFGLRRAFTQAGAKSLVMSLWSVPDKETKELMVQFYQNVLSGKMNRREALRQAALHQMEIVKARYGAAHPYYWGAFVFLGEP